MTDWAKTQSTGLVGQLQCGARAFDYRPQCEDGGHIYAHHGGISIKKPMKESVQDLIDWSASNPSDMIVLYLSHFDGDNCPAQVQDLLKSMGVYFVTDCNSLNGLTYDAAFKASTSTLGGHIFGVFDCMEEAYDSSINCYGPDYVCYDKNKEKAWSPLKSYMTNITKTKPVSNGILWMAQAHWQSDAYSISSGTLHRSSILIDEQKSGVNSWLASQIQANTNFPHLNMIEVDNVCDGGVALKYAVDGFKVAKGLH